MLCWTGFRLRTGREYFNRCHWAGQFRHSLLRSMHPHIDMSVSLTFSAFRDECANQASERQTGFEIQFLWIELAPALRFDVKDNFY